MGFAKDLTETLTYILAGGYFVFRWVSGYLSTNLSLEIVLYRQSSPQTQRDVLRVVVILTKGDRGSAHLFNVGVNLDGQWQDVIQKLEHYPVKKLDSWRRSIARA
jgi:hypothetical protein